MVMGDDMYTIKKNVSSFLEIKNSKFITLLIKISDEEVIPSILEKVKEDYKDATHYCYAYRLSEKEKASDDNEPSGTAGIPILNVLQKNDLINVMCVVIRYFGGIKLGAGGLVRAYSKSVTEALKQTEKTLLIKGVLLEIHTSYDQQKRIDYLLKDSSIIARSFSEDIIIKAHTTKETLDILNNHNISYNIIKEINIEKEF